MRVAFGLVYYFLLIYAFNFYPEVTSAGSLHYLSVECFKVSFQYNSYAFIVRTSRRILLNL